ncbi:hypothetical protein ACG02S_10165 [Roseateles sp. DC23W]|uniref:Uncharacterized protein n=1 Tax=Pelomonas dachongensis TaxID=3299029 RepID=A0ABW7EMY8_9BURK
MNLHIDETHTPLSTEQSLMGWRREFCVELLGDGQARVFLRAVEAPSLKATDLHRGVLFHRVGAGFADMNGCVAAAREPLERLARTAVRQQPSKDNLFAAVTYDRGLWDQVTSAVDQWQRRPPASSRGVQATVATRDRSHRQ